MEMTDRKKQILKIVVEEYVAAAEPVGSKAIAQRMPGKISSATIRNELADLTEMGYLEQPHTSAGRVPSAKGYRLYVNELMEHRALSREEEDKLNASLAEKLAVKNATLMWPVRIAAAGKAVTPGGAVEICHVLGREETLRRLRLGLDKLR